MTKAIEKVAFIQFEHQLWLNELQYYFNEIIIITKKLEGFLEEQHKQQNNSILEELMANFMVHKTDLKTLMSDIVEHERNMIRLASLNGSVDAIVNSTHDDKRKAIDDFKAEYKGLKLTFLEWMERMV